MRIAIIVAIALTLTGCGTHATVSTDPLTPSATTSAPAPPSATAGAEVVRTLEHSNCALVDGRYEPGNSGAGSRCYTREVTDDRCRAADDQPTYLTYLPTGEFYGVAEEPCFTP